MTTSTTLPLVPFEHLSMDYARLREEGLDILGRLTGAESAGAQWTDYNTHDPGITILEQICYAITDLGYRTDFPMQELLGDDDWLPRPEAILPTDPVTTADVRRAAVDVAEVGNAWVEDGSDRGVVIYHHAGSQQLRFVSDATAPDVVPVKLQGLNRVVVQADAQQRSIDGDLVAVHSRLHAGRALGSDFEAVRARFFPVDIHASLEVDTVEDPASLMAEIEDSISAYLAPSARFTSRADLRFEGQSLEALFEGPHLHRGVLTELPERRRTVHVSDVLRVILDVPQVKAVRFLSINGPAADEKRWAIDVPDGAVAGLASTAQVQLLRNGLPLHIDPNEVSARRRGNQANEQRNINSGDPQPTTRSARSLQRHRSLRYQLPAAYGVGPLGLPASASPERQAQARQLSAYLMIFDQLFANALAQLAHARDLLSPVNDGRRTYFADPVEDDGLDVASLRQESMDAHRSWLQNAVDPDAHSSRQQRFLTHLLARFGEELGEYAQLEKSSTTWADPNASSVSGRRAFLRDYARLSRARGSGYDVYQPGVNGGFADRLRRKLGLADARGLHVVEHVLLRPYPEDQAQQVDEGESEIPLLDGVSISDPWSLHVSVVIEDVGTRDETFERFVAQTVIAELPAHLKAHIYWLGDDELGQHWREFEAAWLGFQDAYRDYQMEAIDAASVSLMTQLRTRDARDRVIDLLGFGRTFPLRDLPVPKDILIAPGMQAKIAIEYSQPGVVYRLCARETGDPIAGVGAIEGTGGRVEFLTDAIASDTSFRIQALKKEGADSPQLRRQVWLSTVVRVVENLDAKIEAQIMLPPLDVVSDNAPPTAARVGDFGVEAQVEVWASQEGVRYELIKDAEDLSDPANHEVFSVQPVVGTLGTIVLQTIPVQADMDLRIRGQREVATETGVEEVTRTIVLDTVLPLRIRANPEVPAALESLVVNHGGATALRFDTAELSTVYGVYRGPVRSEDYVFGDAGRIPTVEVQVDDHTTRIRAPALPGRWMTPPGYVLAEEASAVHADEPLRVELGDSLQQDMLVIVRATKQHATGTLDADGAMIASSVPLTRAHAVLVRPDAEVALRFVVTMADGATQGALQVFDGQPGVFYTLQIDDGVEPLGRPAYFHGFDDDDARLNRGVGQVVVGVDSVVAAPPSQPVTERPIAAPEPARIEIAPIQAGTVVRVQARKALNGLTANLVRRATFHDVPALAAVPARVSVGQSAIIRVSASRPDEEYQLLRNGQGLGVPVVGTGAALRLPTGPIDAETVFTVAITRTGGDELIVERRADVRIALDRPDDDSGGAGPDGNGAPSDDDSGGAGPDGNGAPSDDDSGGQGPDGNGAPSDDDSGGQGPDAGPPEKGVAAPENDAARAPIDATSAEGVPASANEGEAAPGDAASADGEPAPANKGGDTPTDGAPAAGASARANEGGTPPTDEAPAAGVPVLKTGGGGGPGDGQRDTVGSTEKSRSKSEDKVRRAVSSIRRRLSRQTKKK